MKLIIAIALAVVAGSAHADTNIADCQRLSPADAVVLSGAQLQVRYCEAKAKKVEAMSLKFSAELQGIAAIDRLRKTDKENAETRRQTEKSVDEIRDQYAACDAAMGNISKLAAEKGTKIDVTCGEKNISKPSTEKGTKIRI